MPILTKLTPNHSGPIEYFSYSDGTITSIENDKKLKTEGWVVEVRTNDLKKTKGFVYLRGDSIFLDISDYSIDLNPKTTSISLKKYPGFRKIKITGLKTEISIKVLVNPLLYLSNDGMFPDSVEPFSELLGVLATLQGFQQRIKFLKTGDSSN